MIVVGIGANSSATVEDIVQALERAMAAAPQTLERIATLSDASFTAAVKTAAHRLDVTFNALENAALQSRAADCVTHSERSMTAHGVPSVAEACALVGAGAGSALIAPRRIFGAVTVALARSSQ